MRKTFKIYTLGCKVNQYESGGFREKLRANNFLEAGEEAGLAIVHTCSVTQKAIVKNKRMIALAKKENPKAKIIITGCWPRVYQNEARELRADFIIKEKEWGSLWSKIKNLDWQEEILNSKLQDETKINQKTSKSRYFLKIQDGCEQFCAYCLIPYTRGKLTSRDEKEALAEIKKAVQTGYREVVLCGIHLGLYGEENEYRKRKRGSLGGFKLAELLRKIIQIPDFGRVRLSSIEITEVNDALIKLMADSPKICEHLHISLQSGSDKILKAMNRPYTTDFFAKRAEKLRKLMPEIAITTDVIVGFPGETDKEFQKTCSFIEKIKFSKAHVFSFSAHEKTAAFRLKNKVPQETIKKRSQKLRQISQKLETAYKQKFIGKKLAVVIDGRIKNNKKTGKTEYYFDLVKKKGNKEGIGNVEIWDVTEESLR